MPNKKKFGPPAKAKKKDTPTIYNTKLTGKSIKQGGTDPGTFWKYLANTKSKKK